ncbi:XkdQ/YqbQ family protein [Lactiplantibacillus herbarum]|uniref:XkdQ/YqbQ family protein n=1 Tax=Lactiplantibacillus herbarum TaxID=1670446 RepID=UPI00069FCCB9|nr:hypothetical protein [Lactiplantibacillus herbarum]
MTVTKFTVGRRTDPRVWDVRSILSGVVTWTTDLNYSAGTLEFEMIEVNEGFTPHMGDIVEFYWDNTKVFYGYVFDFKYTNEKFTVTAYDKLRYFKNQDSLVWPVSTLSQRFTKVAKMAGVSYRVVNNSEHKLVAEVADGKSYFDMLQSSIETTQKATGSQFFLATNYDTVELRKAPYKETTLVVGDKSLMTKFEYEQSIDDAANVVRVIRENEDKGQRSTATAGTKDPSNTSFTAVTASGNINKWGRLQTIETAEEKANEAQMRQQAKDLLKSKNKPTNKLTLTVIGDPALVAGNSAWLKVQSLADIGYGTQAMLITKATHRFSADYMADIEMKV